MASKRGGYRVKPYSLKVKTYTATGKLARKSIPISSNRADLLQEETSLRVSNFLPNNSEEFEAEGDRRIDEEEELRSRYERRRINEGECWKSLQDKLVKTYIEVSAMLPDQCCVKCVEDGRLQARSAKIRCLDCGPNQFFCHQCAEELHLTRNLFHVVELWKVKTCLM